MQDSALILQQQVLQAYTEQESLSVVGGNSKCFYGNSSDAEIIKTTCHTGVLQYEPTELVITARAGTSLQEIEQTLAAKHQTLAFEPPHFSGEATLGGMIAAGLSGPARPYQASVQDAVLGCTILNGKGEVLRFGGKVMKNVAGYDVSRLMVGSLGCLGIILDVTMKVVPASAAEATFAFKVEHRQCPAFINELRHQGFPVSATCHNEGELLIRFSAGKDEIDNLNNSLDKNHSYIVARQLIGTDFWLHLKEHSSPFFMLEKEDPKLSLWRLSVSMDTVVSSLIDAETDFISEWGNCVYWFKSNKQPEVVFTAAQLIGGSASLFKSNNSTITNRFQPLSPVVANWHKQLKKAFDPADILNRGKMYLEF
jgi:glycolate oxidase FAD binding subunit